MAHYFDDRFRNHFGSRRARMKVMREFKCISALVLAVCLFAQVSACNYDKAPQSPADTKAEQTPPPSSTTPTADIAAPSASSVATDAYGNTGSREYWFGQEFSAGGKRYYVGFVSSVPEQADIANDQADAAEGQAAVSHATYVLDGAQWRKLAVGKEFGRFGMNDQAPALTVGATAAGFENGGRYVLAIPAWHTEMGGVEMRTAEIFAFDSGAQTWKYLGSLYTGENGDAGCTGEGKTVSGAVCTASTGEVKFLSNAKTGFPDITVARSGTALGNDGKARALGAADAIDYTYSASSGAYAESQKK